MCRPKRDKTLCIVALLQLFFNTVCCNTYMYMHVFLLYRIQKLSFQSYSITSSEHLPIYNLKTYNQQLLLVNYLYSVNMGVKKFSQNFWKSVLDLKNDWVRSYQRFLEPTHTSYKIECTQYAVAQFYKKNTNS